jgi:hypothetical protein
MVASRARQPSQVELDGEDWPSDLGFKFLTQSMLSAPWTHLHFRKYRSISCCGLYVARGGQQLCRACRLQLEYCHIQSSLVRLCGLRPCARSRGMHISEVRKVPAFFESHALGPCTCTCLVPRVNTGWLPAESMNSAMGKSIVKQLNGFCSRCYADKGAFLLA